MLERLKELCDQHGIQYIAETDPPSPLKKGDAFYSSDLKVLVACEPLSEKNIQAVINLLEYGEYAQLLDTLDRQHLPMGEAEALWAIRKRYHDDECCMAMSCFSYGFIQGKRAERARRRERRCAL